MIQVNKSPAEAEATGRQPDVEAIRQEIEPDGETQWVIQQLQCLEEKRKIAARMWA